MVHAFAVVLALVSPYSWNVNLSLTKSPGYNLHTPIGISQLVTASMLSTDGWSTHTLSPFSNPTTPSPTSSTRPEASHPRTTGHSRTNIPCADMNTSKGFRATARILTSIWPLPGLGMGRVPTMKGAPADAIWMALCIVMVVVVVVVMLARGEDD